MPFSSTPRPCQTSGLPTWANAFSTNSRTECPSPVASTSSSGSLCCRINHMPLDKVAGVSPVARGIEIAEEQLLLQPALDRRDRSRDLAGDEGFAADRALVVEKNSVGGVKAISLAVVDRDPMRVKLGRRVGRARIERRGLALGDLLYLAEQLGGRSLIEAGLALQAEDTDGLEQAQGPECVGVGGVFRRLERDLDMRLRREIVDLVRLRLLNDADDIGRVGDVAVVHMERDPLLVRYHE